MNKYYVITIDADLNLSTKYIGKYKSEDSALTEANKYGKKNGISVIWTCPEDKIKQLFESLKTYEFKDRL